MIERFLIWINKDEVPVTVADRILECVSLVLMLVLIVASIVFYVYAPEQVPMRFNLLGEVTSWGSKDTCFILTAAGVLGVLLCLFSAYNHKYIHIPVRIRPECRIRQLMLMGRMMRVVAILIGLLFLNILFSMAAICFDFAGAWHSVLPQVIVIVLLVVILVFTVWINRIGRR